MTTNQYQIKIHNDTQIRKIYIVAGINFGFAIRDFVFGKNIYAIKSGALIFLAKYKENYAKAILKKKLKISVSATQIIFSFQTTPQNLSSDINKFFEVINSSPTKEEADTLLKQFKIDYAQTFSRELKEELRYLEFLHHHKRFSLDQLHRSIEHLTFEEVQKVQKFIFEKSKYNLYIRGNVQEHVAEFEKFNTKLYDTYSIPVVIPLSYKEKIWKEVHFKGTTPKKTYLIHTNTTQINIEDIFLTYQFLSERYSKKKVKIVIDSLEMGCIVPDILDLKKFQLTEKTVEQYKQKILLQYEYLNSRKRQFYSEYFMKLWLAGLDYVDYYLYLRKLTLEEIKEKITSTLEISQFCMINISDREQEGKHE